ncbi:MAG: arsenic efflux protein [Clostridia bacterium]|nr:arsenic efflux protein [Clostridia bacterium]
MKDVIIDTLFDNIKLLPFLFLTYLLMEYIEHKTGEKAEAAIRRAGKIGPLAGGVLGIVPQCGFSASASGFYAGRVISLGTLIAVFLSTSDEMLPICISHQAGIAVIAKILAFKAVAGIVLGFLTDAVMRLLKKGKKPEAIHCLCENDDCHCEEEGIIRSALHHTVKIAAFILIITFALNTAIHFIGEENLGRLFVDIPVLSSAVAGLVGLIPNCAASVVITELFLQGVISTGAMLSGLLTGSGIGLLVLFRTNRNIKENIGIALLVWLLGTAVGAAVSLAGVSFL